MCKKNKQKNRRNMSTKGFTVQVDGDNLSLLYNPKTEEMMVIRRSTLLGWIIKPCKQFNFKGAFVKEREELKSLLLRIYKKIG